MKADNITRVLKDLHWLRIQERIQYSYVSLCSSVNIVCELSLVGLALYLVDYRPLVVWHCWSGHLTHKTIPEMTYNVLTGTVRHTVRMARPTEMTFKFCYTSLLPVIISRTEHRHTFLSETLIF